jgi:ferric-dicitrate binding protein FerR (iron transport regulator)
LIPGEQASLGTEHLAVGDVDAAKVIAWKDGYFRFDNTPIEQVMRELGRWYDIEVIYEGLSRERLNGKISRTKNISKVLTALEATRTVHFKIEGRRVTVMK